MGQTGADFMVGKLGEGKKRPSPSLAAPAEVTPAQLDDVEKLLDRADRDGKKLVQGLGATSSVLDRIAECGFTPDLLVVLVTEKAPYPRGSKHRLTQEQVRAALKGLFAIGEFLR
jgi:hypothetical protein